MTKVGIIGGSGLDDPKILQDAREVEMDTRFGHPSSPLMVGQIKGIDVVLLSRHGKQHQHSPTQVNYRANIYALKSLGVSRIISINALQQLIQLLDQIGFHLPGGLLPVPGTAAGAPQLHDNIHHFSKQLAGFFH